MKTYRLDPKNPRQLTPEEAQQLEAAPIDYSDIPPLDQIDWSRCPQVERTDDTLSGAWRIKGRRVPVSAILDNHAADQTPLQIARMFGLPVATVRKVLHFALSAELAEAWARRDGFGSREERYRIAKLGRQLREIERGLERSR